MYDDFISEMTFNLLECNIMNIYTSDEKVVIGLGGVNKDCVEFKSIGVAIKIDTHITWYPYASIQKIEVY